MARTPEGRISERVVHAIRALDQGYARKVHVGMYGTLGEPDIDGCVRGRAVKLEVKQPDARRNLSPHQRRMLRVWHDAGALCGVVTSPFEALALLAHAGLVVPGESVAFPAGDITALTQFWLEEATTT